MKIVLRMIYEKRKRAKGEDKLRQNSYRNL